MNINFEKIPPVIFDWVETASFDKLSISQKNEVLLYFSEEDYEGMYQASKNLKSVLKHNSVTVNTEKKNQLLTRFDLNRQQKKQGKIKMLIVWQAAAVLLMVLSGWLFYHVFDLQKAANVQTVASTDTVYVTKEPSVQPEQIHDTIYLYKESESIAKQHPAAVTVYEANEPKESTNTETMPAMELENVNFSTKGNSMKDDSLLKKFGFVAM